MEKKIQMIFDELKLLIMEVEDCKQLQRNIVYQIAIDRLYQNVIIDSLLSMKTFEEKLIQEIKRNITWTYDEMEYYFYQIPKKQYVFYESLMGFQIDQKRRIGEYEFIPCFDIAVSMLRNRDRNTGFVRVECCAKDFRKAQELAEHKLHVLFYTLIFLQGYITYNSFGDRFEFHDRTSIYGYTYEQDEGREIPFQRQDEKMIKLNDLFLQVHHSEAIIKLISKDLLTEMERKLLMGIVWGGMVFTQCQLEFALMQGITAIENILDQKKTELIDAMFFLVGDNLLSRQAIKRNMLKILEIKEDLLDGVKIKNIGTELFMVMKYLQVLVCLFCENENLKKIQTKKELERYISVLKYS
ncbi:MAG: hypothetical protein IKC46_02235 [Lachnospiraceae bacterium]|nr:hypothetical protein [Lachnospiraceae bacterium]